VVVFSSTASEESLQSRPVSQGIEVLRKRLMKPDRRLEAGDNATPDDLRGAQKVFKAQTRFNFELVSDLEH
jgi:hypothetical protein